MNLFPVVAAAGLKQQNFYRGIFTQPIGENASGRPGANDDVVIHSRTPGSKDQDGGIVILLLNRLERHLRSFTLGLALPGGKQFGIRLFEILLG